MGDTAALEVEIRHLTESNTKLADAVDRLAVRVDTLEKRNERQDGAVAVAKWLIAGAGAVGGFLLSQAVDWLKGT